MLEIMFSHQKSVKKAFFLSYLSPGGPVLPKEESVIKPSKWTWRAAFFNPHIFDHLKTTGHVRNHVFSSEEC